MYTIVLLTEDVLTPHDVDRVVHLHDPEPVRVHVVVPIETEQHRFLQALDEVALGRLRGADSPRGPVEAKALADASMAASVAAINDAGAEATGAVVAADPVDATVAAAEIVGADEIFVLTEPHLVEESLRRDWASRIRSAVSLPVLHVVAGTDRVVS